MTATRGAATSSPEFDGMTAIVTGAGSGIGRATAIRFAEAGARLVVVGRRAGPLEEVAHHLRGPGSEVAIVVGSASDPAVAAEAIHVAVTRFGSLDVLVNNAGMALMKTVPDTSPEEWSAVLATNLTSVFLFCREAIPRMAGTGGGSIVSVASEAGIVGFAGYAAYSASKAGVVNLTRAMALDHARDRIRVNCVCPGSIETPMLRAYYEASSDPSEVRRLDAATHPLGIGTPDDIAEAILYLAGKRSRYITGHALIVDGGFTAG